jgi:PAS domain S-box-containing protein
MGHMQEGRYSSITQKLTWINMLVSGAALLLACGLFITYELTALRSAIVRSLSIEAEIIATNSASALTFGDSLAAANTLSALKAAPNIISAGVYGASGTSLAVYWRDGGNASLPMVPLPAGESEAHSFSSDELTLTRETMLQGKPIGFVYIRSDLHEMNDRLKHDALIVLGVLLLSLASAFAISFSLLRAVTRPILRLAETAGIVSREKDYSARAPATDSRDEVHILVDAFNTMLSQIQERDAALQRAHARLNLTLQSAGVGIWSMEVSSGALALDLHVYPLLGLKETSPLATFQEFLERVHPDDRAQLQHQLQEAIRCGSSYEAEFRLVWPDGTVRTLSVRGNIDLDAAGIPCTLTGVCWDITEKKRAEEELRASEERFRTLANSAPVMIWLSGTDRLRSWFNNRWLEFVGRDMQAELGDGWVENVHPDDVARYLAIYEAAFAERREFSLEYRLKRHDGSWRTVLATGVPLVGHDHQFAGYIGSCIDITENKEALLALKASQEQYRTLAESLPHLVWTCAANGLCDYLSPQWAEYTGHPAQEQLGNGWTEHVHPADRERIQAAWALATTQGQQFDAEFRIRRADGAYHWFRNRSVPLHDASGNVIKWFGSNTDFDDYKQAEQTLKAHVERLGLLDHITRGIGARQDLSSVFQVVISTLEESLPIDFGCICLHAPENGRLNVTCTGGKSGGLARELALTEQKHLENGQDGLAKWIRGQLVYESDVSRSDVAFARQLAAANLRSVVIAPLLFESNVFGALVASRRDARAFSSGECEFLRQVGEHVALAAHQAQIHEALQQAYDDLHRTQQAVMQQERLRALGQMASGIAHDINNALSPMALYTESLLQREPNLSQRTREYLETAQRALEDVAHTVSRMQEFYRQREPQLTLAPVRLNPLVEQVLELTRARWRDMPQERGVLLRLETDLAPDLPRIMGIEGEIRDALTNLIFNATDAMPEGGSLKLRTRSVSLASGTEVHVEVTDTGIGMDENIRRRCLEPFFTTKGERGTGLGLAMVYGMLQRHGGKIEIDSERGQGTTVRMIFSADATLYNQPERTEQPYRLIRGLQILIVDDDPMVIKSLREVLEMDGQQVTIAHGGRAGIDTFASSYNQAKPFDLVITDLGMPEVDGATVALATKSISPATPVILLTGWGQRLAGDNEIPPGVDRVLSKPPKLKELRNAFMELLTPFPSAT